MSYRFSDQIDYVDFESEHIVEFLIAKTLVSGNFMYKERYGFNEIIVFLGVKLSFDVNFKNANDI